MANIKIVADKNIPQVREMYSELGELDIRDGHAITAEVVRDADVLLVRSVTLVDRKLLDGSRVRFVGTATIGTDHVDAAYLREKGVAFASAPGSNSRSVAEYILAVLLTLGGRLGFRLEGRTIGVVGVGNVGSKVAAIARTMGMNVLLNDPPLARTSPEPQRYVSLDRLMDADIVTLHVPLTMKGPDATFHLFDAGRIGRMKRGAILLNSSRGKVVETEGARRALEGRHLAACVLDVWEHEPGIDVDLLKLTAIGTPHIAGYSYDGKINGAEMIYHAVCAHLGIAPSWNRTMLPTASDIRKVVLSGTPDGRDGIIRDLVRRCYDIQADDERLRKIIAMPAEERKSYFTYLRSTYPVRREFHATTVTVPARLDAYADLVSSLGFSVVRGTGGD